MLKRLKNRQFGIRDVIKTSWDLIILNWRQLFLLISYLYIPINLIRTLISEASVANNYGERTVVQIANACKFIDSLIGCIVVIGVAFIIEKSILGERSQVSDALRFGFSRWGKALITEMLLYLIVFGWSLLLIIPGLIWLVYYSFSIIIVALRDLSGKSALDYSKKLVQGQWWRVITISMLISILCLMVGGLATLIFRLRILPDISLIRIFFAWLVVDIVKTWGTVMYVVFFLNMDYRRNTQDDKVVI